MNLILIAILACEIGFWVVLALGLTARYGLRLRALSNVLLLAVPVLDLVLLGLITWDMLVGGATADFAHGLGALYLGFTVAFGHQLIQRVDAHVAHRFAGGPKPEPRPKKGLAGVAYEWRQWFRMLACAAIACAVLGAIIFIVGDPARTGELLAWFPRIGLVVAVWLVGWPIWATVAYALNPATASGHPSSDAARATADDGTAAEPCAPTTATSAARRR